MECHGSYGSKIQTLVKHLLYLEVIEPGAKSIVFSAWADSLHSEDWWFLSSLGLSSDDIISQSLNTHCRAMVRSDGM